MDPCAALKDINYYHPKNNYLGFVVYAASSCGGSFRRAFSDGTDSLVSVKYSNPAEGPTLVASGYENSDGSVQAVQTGDAAREPDDYERLNKALAMYNGDRLRVINCSLLDVVVGTQKAFAKKASRNCRDIVDGNRDVYKEYSKHILHGGEGKLTLPYRTYVWQVGTGAEAYCFKFGEAEWLNPEVDADGIPMGWKDYKNAAQLDAARRTNCE